MSDRHDARVLNDLIERLLDSVDGYEEAIKDAGDASYGPLFVETAENRRSVAETLSAEVRARGETPDDDGSFAAAAERVFVRLRDLLSHSDEPVLETLEQAEEALKAAFQSALEDSELSGPARDAVIRAYDGVKPGHDRLLQLRERLRG